ncbi:MAG: hypothetical protein IJE53_00180 [Bacilli bacterium]|nr:hypothetical protein [Bacilli bacterium]
MKKLIKKIVYYIVLTIAFLILPFSIRNIYLSILVKENIIDFLINLLASIFIFLYPLSIALMIRYNIKNDKWPINILNDEVGEENE